MALEEAHVAQDSQFQRGDRSGHAAITTNLVALLQRIKLLAKLVGALARLGLERASLLHACAKFLIDALTTHGGLRLAGGQSIAFSLGCGATATKILGGGLRLIHQRLAARREFLRAVRGFGGHGFGLMGFQFQMQRALGGFHGLTKSLARLGSLLHALGLLLGDAAMSLQIALGRDGILLESLRVGLGHGRELLQFLTTAMRVLALATHLGFAAFGGLQRLLRAVHGALRGARGLALTVEPFGGGKHGIAVTTRTSFGLECGHALAIHHGARFLFALAFALEGLERSLQFGAGHGGLIAGLARGLHQGVAATHRLGGGFALTLHMRLQRAFLGHGRFGLHARALGGGTLGLELGQCLHRRIALHIGALQRFLRERLLRLGAMKGVLGVRTRGVHAAKCLVCMRALRFGARLRFRDRATLALQSIHECLHHATLEQGLFAGCLRRGAKALGALVGLARGGVRALGAGHGLFGQLLCCGATAFRLVGTRLLLTQATLGVFGGLTLRFAHGEQALHFFGCLGGRIATHLRGLCASGKLGFGFHRLMRQRIGVLSSFGGAGA